MLSSRQLAFIALGDVHKGAYTDVAIDRALHKGNLDERDRRFLTELVYGSTRRQRTLDTIIDQLGKKSAQQQAKDLRTILHLGLYQLRYQEKIPASAAVNTTVQLAKDNGFKGLTGVVNGLLRQYIRLTEKTKEPLTLPDNPVERLGILHSFPDWIIEVWLEQFGFDATEKLCMWMNQTPAIDLRVNPLRSSLEEVEMALQGKGIQYQRLPNLPQALRLISSPGNIQNLPGFDAGWWTVQDSSAQLVGYLLNPQPEELIIDVCAAPGGKTTHLAELMGDKGKIYAGDRTTSRLRRLQQNAQRLGLKSIEIFTGDGRSLSQFDCIADRVLLDVPCSGLGTLNRHADARWRQTPTKVKELALLQQELITHAATFVKPRGVMVYATCTLHPAENEDVIGKFLRSHPHWQIIESLTQDSSLATYASPSGWIKVLPHQHNMDGFFMVRLRNAKN
ncbi:MAG: 16S rRNA (cytosine(967)-C(5))-methyltransferase [Richelia sp.]|nr:16S rRNA (cytosine(967)-C(5))-methyltransferase [Richelia sp.]CDN15200.1 Ribosomal RNA small subunit methyltransferase B [Richelia intracellularis]